MATNPFQDFINSLQQANLNSGKWLSQNLDNAGQAIENNPIVKGVGNAVTQGVNNVGQAIGNTPITSMPNSPTIGQTYNSINQNLAGSMLPGGDILQGKATPASLGGAALFAGTMGMEGGNPEDAATDGNAAVKDQTPAEPPQAVVDTTATQPQVNTTQPVQPLPPIESGQAGQPSGILDKNGVNPSEGASGDSFARDMRYKQGTENPNAYKVNTNPQTPVLSTDTTAMDNQPTTALPPIQEEPIKTTATQDIKPNMDRTFKPGNPSDDLDENARRGLDYTDNIQTPKQKAQVNATFNGYKIKGTQDQQLQGIDDQKGILSDAAQAQVAEDGGNTSKVDLLSNMQHDLAYNGSKHNIASPDIPAKSIEYLNNVYVRATGGDPTKIAGDVMPDSVPDTIVQKMKSIMGKDASSTFGKDPSTWTPFQQVSRYGRNAFDSILDKNHPEAAVLNNDMADLYNGEESIRAGANAEGKAAQKAAVEEANTVKPNIFQRAGNVIGAVAHNPIAQAAGISEGLRGGADIGTLIGAGGIAGKFLADKTGQAFNAFENKIGYAPKDKQIKKSGEIGAPSHQGSKNSNEPSSITDPQSPIHPGIISQPGRYAEKTPQELGFQAGKDFRSQDSAYTKQIADLQGKLDVSGSSLYQSQIDQVKGQQKQLEDTFNDPLYQKVITTGGDYNEFAGVANPAIPLINKAPLNLLNLNGSYDKLLNSTDKNYQSLGIFLQKLQKQTGINFAQATSGDQIINMLDSVNEIMKNPYTSAKQQYFGGNTLNAGGITTGNDLPPIVQPINTGLPAIGTPVHYDFKFGRAGDSLPAIK